MNLNCMTKAEIAADLISGILLFAGCLANIFVFFAFF